MLTVPSRKRRSKPASPHTGVTGSVCLLVREKRGNGPVLRLTFSGIEAAEAYIQARSKNGSKLGFLAFWTLGPGSDADARTISPDAEVTVLISDDKDAEFVCAHRFADMESAREFVRCESAANACINWSIPISISTDEQGQVRLSRRETTQAASEALNATAQADVREALRAANKPRRAKETYTMSAFISEVRSVLEVKRWQVMSGDAFSGFGSPPGRF